MIVTIGEAMASLRGAAPLARGSDLRVHVAGAEANVAIGLARLGHQVCWVSRVGDDEPGRLVVRELRAEGVDVDRVGVDPQRPTGVMFALRRSADLTVVDYRRTGSAATALSGADVDFLAGRRDVTLVASGLTMALGPGPREAVERAVALVHQAGGTVVLDVNQRDRLWSRTAAAAALRPLLERVDVLVAGTDELDVVTDLAGDEERAAAGLLDTVGVLLLKRGAEGASCWNRDERGVQRIDRAAVPVTAVDPIGAGDAFTAGWVSAFADGLRQAERLERAVLMGAWAVGTSGDWEGLPRRDELDQLGAPGTTRR